MAQQTQMLNIGLSTHHQLLISTLQQTDLLMTIHQQHQELLQPQLRCRLLRLQLRPLQCRAGT